MDTPPPPGQGGALLVSLPTRVGVPEFATSSAAAIERAGSATTEDINALIQRLQAVKASRVPRLTIKDCLPVPGVYVYHVAGLTVQDLDRPEHRWCVVKVGMTIDNTIDGRLQTELRDIMNWRGSPRRPRITINSLDGDGVGDIVALFPGASWPGSEKKIRRRLGLPLGTGIVGEPSDPVPDWMRQEHSDIRPDATLNGAGIVDGSGKITNLGWSMFFKRGGRETSIGPSELIMMREWDMGEVLRKSFKENPASFASTFPGTNVDQETGPAWGLIKEVQDNLRSDRQRLRVKVRFNCGNLGQERMDEQLPELELELQDEDELRSAVENMLRDELRAALADEGASTNGSKAELVERLLVIRRAAAAREAEAAARLRGYTVLVHAGDGLYAEVGAHEVVAHEEQKEE